MTDAKVRIVVINTTEKGCTAWIIFTVKINI